MCALQWIDYLFKHGPSSFKERHYKLTITKYSINIHIILYFEKKNGEVIKVII